MEEGDGARNWGVGEARRWRGAVASGEALLQMERLCRSWRGDGCAGLVVRVSGDSREWEGCWEQGAEDGRPHSIAD